MSAAPSHRVVAILVTRNGEEWVGAALRTLQQQSFGDLGIVVVDNASSDTTLALVEGRVPEDHVLRQPRNLGFGRAVTAALRHPAVTAAELVLLVHDDLVLARDAVEHLVEAMDSDPTLGIVGPKLREWAEEHVLAEVGMTTDRFGRADTLLDAGELDQGQRDGQRDVLYVSTAGMLLRREVLARLPFDPRFPLFRDDLDLCWRAWLSGSRVGVVTDAIGYHIAAATSGLRPPFDVRPQDVRYLSERHTLAAQLKNHGLLRLAWVLPGVLLLGLLRALGLLVARRFAEAFAILRAQLWNAGQLGRTLRRRTRVQRGRAIRDRELAVLLAPGLARLRTCAEAVAGWLAGGGTRTLVDPGGEEVTRASADPLAERPVRRFLRDRPAVVVGVPLLLAYLVGLIPLLGPGPVVGGQVAPWPQDSTAFLRSYTSPWGGEPLASAAFPSPVQAFLGMLSVLAGSSPWVAQRLAVFGLLPVAWFLALRAGRLVTGRRWPRVLGATVYALAVPVLGALATGRYGALLVASLLPGLVALTFRAGDPRTPPGSAWRAAALLALGLAICASAAPLEASVLAAMVAVGLLAVLVGGGPGRRSAVARLLVALGGATALLAPWLVDLVRAGGLGLGSQAAVEPLPLWRALLLAPPLLPGLGGTGAVVPALVTAAVVLAGLLVGLRARPLLTAGLILLVAVSGLGAAALARLGSGPIWVPAVLLPGALALAVLAVVVGRWFNESLRARDFGLRQIGITLAAAASALGLLGATAALAETPWEALALDPQLVPAFVSAEEGALGPYRVLLLDDDGGAAEAVRWTVTRGGGVSMLDFGAPQSPRLVRALDEAVATIAAGGDPSAGGRLGLLNVRYVILMEPSPELADALVRQPALDPLPVSGGQVYRVDTWLPRASLVPAEAADALLADGVPAQGLSRVVEPLRPLAPGFFQGRARGTGAGLVVVSEAASAQWQAAAGATRLEPTPLGDVIAFRLPEGEGERTITAQAEGALRRRVIVLAQVVVGLLLLSLAIRPPGATERKTRRVRVLPAEISREGDRGEAGGQAVSPPGRNSLGQVSGVGPASGPLPVGSPVPPGGPS